MTNGDSPKMYLWVCTLSRKTVMTYVTFDRARSSGIVANLELGELPSSPFPYPSLLFPYPSPCLAFPSFLPSLPVEVGLIKSS